MKEAKPEYSYSASLKSDVSDELINVYLIRPLAGVLVRFLYPTPLRPNHLTIAATLVGIAAAALYYAGYRSLTAAAGLLITLKDILDSADGQLARAKRQFSRAGRFLDSIGDMLVNAVVFLAIGRSLQPSTVDASVFVLSVLCFLGTTLRVSYHVFYQTSFLHLQSAYTINRLTEEIREEDVQGDRVTLTLQSIFQALYGWQDRFMLRVDSWSRRGISLDDAMRRRWYADRTGLRLSGLLGLGTELFLLMLFSVVNRLEMYLYVNAVVLNLVWLACVFYRRRLLMRAVGVR